MKKNILKYIIILLLIFLIGCKSTTTYTTLQEVVKSKVDADEISIINEYSEKGLVLCATRSQYILGVYSYNNGVYNYFKIHSKNDIPESNILIQTERIDKIGNIVWGTINSEESAAKFVIEYLNGETQVIEAVNNSFIVSAPKTLQDESSLKLRSKILNVFAVNEYDKVLDKLKTYNEADPIMVFKY